jgi:hypothetical protein
MKALGQTNETLPAIAAQQGVGTAVSLGAYKLGQTLDPELAKPMRKWVRNLGGRYGLIAVAAFEAGQADQAGKKITPVAAGVKALEGGFPMPTTEVPKDWINFIVDASQGKWTTPRSALPLALPDSVKEALGAAPMKDSPNYVPPSERDK